MGLLSCCCHTVGSLDNLEGLLVDVGCRGVDASLDVARHGTHLIGERHPIGEALANTSREYDVGGPLLRRYWLNYSGVTRWRANASYRLRGDLSALVGGENLLNVQRGAPDNATVTAGRTAPEPQDAAPSPAWGRKDDLV